VNLDALLSVALDPARVLLARGMSADPWQRAFLLGASRQVLLCCSRQSGKSTVVSALALHTALFTPGALVLLLSPSLRQSSEIFRKVLEADDALGRPLPSLYRSQFRLELANGSRVLCLPGREETIRSFGGVNLLVLDEAARIPDALYRSVRPMLAVSRGRLVALSTPFGRRGWFYHEWAGSGPWDRVRITWRDCPRTTFTALEGLVYPELPSALVDLVPLLSGRAVGGIDFGWKNPFAALWGILDADDVLWITGERYSSRVPLAQHTSALLPLKVSVWYADPAGANEISAMRSAGLTVRRGTNAIRPGIAAVSARLQTGRLRILRTACPNLIREAGLYRYPSGDEADAGENPVDADNHALAALRYLIAGLDARFLARFRRGPEPDAPDVPTPDTSSLWTPLS
jgi:hypothetical protein